MSPRRDELLPTLFEKQRVRLGDREAPLCETNPSTPRLAGALSSLPSKARAMNPVDQVLPQMIKNLEEACRYNPELPEVTKESLLHDAEAMLRECSAQFFEEYPEADPSPVMMIGGRSYVAVMPLPGELFNNEHSKDNFAEMVKRLLAVLPKLTHFVLMTSCWYMEDVSEEATKEYKGKDLEHVPGRKEGLLINYQNRLGEHVLRRMEVIRGENTAHLGETIELDMPVVGAVGGRLTNLFNVEKETENGAH